MVSLSFNLRVGLHAASKTPNRIGIKNRYLLVEKSGSMVSDKNKNTMQTVLTRIIPLSTISSTFADERRETGVESREKSRLLTIYD
jgi:hypothetical protein